LSTTQTAIASYLRKATVANADPLVLGYLAGLSAMAEVAPEVAKAVVHELADQRSSLKLIASENYCSLATQLAMGNLLTDKYAEGFPGHRFYAGCENVDVIEAYACEQARELFGAEHAYVQPHSGADANLIAFWAVLHTRVGVPGLEKLGTTNPASLSHEQWDGLRREMGNQRLLGMDYYAGGHLTHGYRHNVSAMMFDAHSYGVDPGTGLLDYDAIEKTAADLKPLILLAGYSAYPRAIDFKRMRAIADGCGATLMVDMAHFAGLVAGGVFEGDYNPIAHADIVTTTTHKTLRGPRGGLVLCKDEFAEAVNKGCPLVIGGPLPHVVAAKAVALKEANAPEFRDYARRIVNNASALAEACIEEGLSVATGGTDNHLLLIDVTGFGITGRQAESALRECGVTLNRNSLPNDINGPWYTSGLRVGTPAATTLGMGAPQMKEVARILRVVLENTSPVTIESGPKSGQKSKAKYVIESSAQEEARGRVRALLEKFPVYPELDLDVLKEHFG
jgi:glycine hydroxymethyltransferase